MGEHNLRNAVAAIALLAEGFNLPVAQLARALLDFKGVKRRQELVATAGGVRLYDDFAHHPTAVEETLRAMRGHHPGAKLIAVFEPRSATACRNTHQAEYPAAFLPADLALIAPVGRAEIAADERLDVPAIVREVNARGGRAETVEPGPASVDAIVARVAAEAGDGDVVAVLSNGAFGGIHGRLARALEARAVAPSDG